MAERDGSIHRRLALAKAEKHLVLGHDLSGPERFRQESRHMVTLDILQDGGSVGGKGDHYRAFLSDDRYQNAKQSEQRGEIKIRSHATVKNGSIIPDVNAQLRLWRTARLQKGNFRMPVVQAVTGRKRRWRYVNIGALIYFLIERTIERVTVLTIKECNSIRMGIGVASHGKNELFER